MSVGPRLPFLSILLISIAFAQPPGGGRGPSVDFLQQGQQRLREGKPDEALVLYKQAGVQANRQTGFLWDLIGQDSDAQKYFAHAIEASPNQIQKHSRLAVRLNASLLVQ